MRSKINTESNQDDLRLLKPEDVAHILDIKKQTLAKWRCTKLVSLPYIKTGRMIRYRYADVQAFIESRRSV